MQCKVGQEQIIFFFNYNEKEYNLPFENHGKICRSGATELTEELLQDCLNTPDYHEINETIIEGDKIKIQGIYSPSKNLLTNYSAVKK